MNKSNEGFTIFQATGVKHEYLLVDLEKQLVTAVVVYNGKTYMTVTVDVKKDTLQIKGSVEQLGELSIPILICLNFKHNSSLKTAFRIRKNITMNCKVKFTDLVILEISLE